MIDAKNSGKSRNKKEKKYTSIIATIKDEQNRDIKIHLAIP